MENKLPESEVRIGPTQGDAKELMDILMKAKERNINPTTCSWLIVPIFRKDVGRETHLMIFFDDKRNPLFVYDFDGNTESMSYLLHSLTTALRSLTKQTPEGNA